MIAFVGAVVAGATGAFFSDTETSTGNTFTAGTIDLQIDNESYVTNNDGDLVYNQNTSWQLANLTVEKFFNFLDLKPGDVGEDTISIHVGSNDAWLCAAAQITADDDVDCTEPELADDSTCVPPGTDEGELDSEVNFAFWVDDGDNVFETCDPNDPVNTACVDEEIFLDGPISGLGQAGQIAIADNSVNPVLQSTPVPGETEFFIAKAWCFGDMTPNPVPQDGQGKKIDDLLTPLVDESKDPIVRGTGFHCDGTNVDNASQTDTVVGDLSFYAEQSRNNTGFLCSSWTPFPD